MLKIGKKLIQLREKNNYSQELVADKIGISQSNYSRIESDKLAPSAEVLPKIAELYGITIQELMGTSGSGYTNASNYKDNAFSAYLVYQDSQKQYEKVIETQNETIATQKTLIEQQQQNIEALKTLVASLQEQLEELKNGGGA